MTSKILAYLPNPHPRNSLTYFSTVICQHSGLPVWMTVLCLVTQLCPTLCNPIDCSLPGSSVHGILQATILEGVAMPSSLPSEPPGKPQFEWQQPWDASVPSMLCVLTHFRTFAPAGPSAWSAFSLSSSVSSRTSSQTPHDHPWNSAWPPGGDVCPLRAPLCSARISLFYFNVILKPHAHMPSPVPGNCPLLLLVHYTSPSTWHRCPEGIQHMCVELNWGWLPKSAWEWTLPWTQTLVPPPAECCFLLLTVESLPENCPHPGGVAPSYYQSNKVVAQSSRAQSYYPFSQTGTNQWLTCVREQLVPCLWRAIPTSEPSWAWLKPPLWASKLTPLPHPALPAPSLPGVVLEEGSSSQISISESVPGRAYPLQANCFQPSLSLLPLKAFSSFSLTIWH